MVLAPSHMLTKLTSYHFQKFIFHKMMELDQKLPLSHPLVKLKSPRLNLVATKIYQMVPLEFLLRSLVSNLRELSFKRLSIIKLTLTSSTLLNLRLSLSQLSMMRLNSSSGMQTAFSQSATQTYHPYLFSTLSLTKLTL